MSTPTAISNDIVSDTGAAATKTASTSTSFGDVFDAISYSTACVAPSMDATFSATDVRGADVISAAVNATASYVPSKDYSYSGAYPYSSTSTSYSRDSSLPTSGTSSDDMFAMAQDQLAQSQADSVSMLMIQDQMGSETRFFTSASNLMSSRDQLVLTIARKIGQ